jgi:hypothetical protein
MYDVHNMPVVRRELLVLYVEGRPEHHLPVHTIGLLTTLDAESFSIKHSNMLLLY